MEVVAGLVEEGVSRVDVVEAATEAAVAGVVEADLVVGLRKALQLKFVVSSATK